MKTLNYSNWTKSKAIYRPIAVYDYLFNEIIERFPDGHYAHQSKDHYYPEDWIGVLVFLNKKLETGEHFFILKETAFKVPND